MRQKTCCFTGHRKIPPGQYKGIAGRLREKILVLIESGYIYFGTGGALGFDTMAALTVLALRKDYPQIKLILVLPCQNQTKGWQQKDIEIYRHIKKSCNKFVYISQSYTPDCMQKRNRHLVENSSVCVAYQTKQTGGTAYTVNYARQLGLHIINITKK